MTVRRRAWAVAALAALAATGGPASSRAAPRASPTSIVALASSSADAPTAPAADDSLAAVRSLIRATRHDAAEALARRCVRRAETAAGAASLACADALDLLAEAMRRGGRGRDPEARDACERALRIRESRQGEEHAATAASLHNLGSLFFVTGEHEAAGPLLERALAIRERTLGPEHPDVAMSLLYVGSLMSDLGEDAGARPLIERAVSIQERALGRDDPDRAFGLQRLANLLYKLRDHVGARPLYEESLAIRERVFGPDDPQVSTGLHNLATLLSEIGDLDAAAAYYERALAIRERNAAATPLLLASTLRNLGQLRRAMGRLAEAERLIARALRIEIERLGPDHPDMAETLLSLAAVHEERGDRRAADSLAARALAVREAAWGGDHPEVAAALAHLAWLRAAGDRAWAFDAALRVEAIGREHLRATARSLAERQALGYAEGRASGLDVAVAILAADARSGARGARSAEARTDPRRVARAWDALIRSRALVLDEMASRSTRTSLAATPDVAAAADTLARARRRLADLWVRGHDGRTREEERRALAAARADVERAERAFADRSAAFRTERDRARIGFDAVAAALPAGTALVAFVRGADPDRLGALPPPAPGARAAFVQRAGETAPALVPLGSAAHLDALVARWVREASRGALGAASPEAAEAACRAAGDSLRAALWDPLGPSVRGAESVYIVPDGPIHFVAFDALPDTGGRYLAETGPIFHTLSAERDLVPDGGVLPRGDGLLAIGGPDFDRAGATPQLAALAAPPRATRAPDCGDLATIRFEPLPASLLEAEEVAARWHAGVGATRPPEALCLTGADATESAFKERAPGRRVLHLATHAFVLSDSCGEAASAGGTRGVGGLAAARAAPWRFAPTRDPLLQAGLAVAGANGRRAARAEDEDGILLAAEIAAMDLSGVDWAVLSACDTGLGEIRLSEGVLGLRRAFQVAGVRTLIMSLWGVDDEETRAWMRALYAARFARGLSTAPALRAASLERLAERRAEGRSTHPFYWGGFVAVGDWN